MRTGTAAMYSLPEVIEQIYKAAIPVCEKRRLASRSIALLLLPGEQLDAPSSADEVYALQSVLWAAGRAVGRTLDVTAAKTALRQHGTSGMKLASRVSKLSKVRNARSHPDVGLEAEVVSLLSVPLSDALQPRVAENTLEVPATIEEMSFKAEVLADGMMKLQAEVEQINAENNVSVFQVFTGGSPDPPDDLSILFITGLPVHGADESIAQVLGPYGDVVSTHILPDNGIYGTHGRSALVEFSGFSVMSGKILLPSEPWTMRVVDQSTAEMIVRRCSECGSSEGAA